MKWPWQRPAVEHRSSYTDQVVTAILASASGGGVRPALATAALETVATLYSSALSACAVSGPPSVVRALTAEWRAAVASSLIRTGQAVYLIDADPSAGLALAPVSHWDVHGGPDVASWFYRCELAGPSSTVWRTRSAGGVLHLRWLIDNTRPWAGVSSTFSTRAIPAVSRAGSNKRLAEEASRAGRRVFCRSRRYDADPDADLDADDAEADPLAAAPARHWRRARAKCSLVESANGGGGFSGQCAETQRFCGCSGSARNPPRHLVELREKVALDIGERVRHPARRYSTPRRSGQMARESWRQFVSTSVDGLCRRLEAQDPRPSWAWQGRRLIPQHWAVAIYWGAGQRVPPFSRRRACPLPTHEIAAGYLKRALSTFPDLRRLCEPAIPPKPTIPHYCAGKTIVRFRLAAWLENQRIRRTTLRPPQKRERTAVVYAA